MTIIINLVYLLRFSRANWNSLRCFLFVVVHCCCCCLCSEANEALRKKLHRRALASSCSRSTPLGLNRDTNAASLVSLAALAIPALQVAEGRDTDGAAAQVEPHALQYSTTPNPRQIPGHTYRTPSADVPAANEKLPHFSVHTSTPGTASAFPRRRTRTAGAAAIRGPHAQGQVNVEQEPVDEQELQDFTIDMKAVGEVIAGQGARSTPASGVVVMSRRRGRRPDLHSSAARSTPALRPRATSSFNYTAPFANSSIPLVGNSFGEQRIDL